MTTNNEAAVLVEKGARDAILFEPIYPPQYGPAATSFFGGLPRLPTRIGWPVTEITSRAERQTTPDGVVRYVGVKERVASTFLGQIDLGRLPGGVRIDPLPRSGTLYFFFDSAALEPERTPGTGGSVIYWPGDCASCTERAPPQLLHPCHGTEAGYHFKWLEFTHSEHRPFPTFFPKWPVRPIVLPTYDPSHSFGKAPEEPVERSKFLKLIDDYWTLLEQRQTTANDAARPPAVPINNSVPQTEPRGQWRGGPGFPYTWICVEIFAGMLIKRIHDDERRKINPPEGYDPKALLVEVTHWLVRSRGEGLYEAVSDAARAEFGAWYHRVTGSATTSLQDNRHWVHFQTALKEAYLVGPRWCLTQSAEAGRRIPSSWVEDQRWQFAINTTGHFPRFIRHSLLPSGGLPPAETYTPGVGLTSDYVFLMRFDSQAGLHWQWGDMKGIEFWIKRKDLEALNFADVTAYIH
jgi:hypothetical protein